MKGSAALVVRVVFGVLAIAIIAFLIFGKSIKEKVSMVPEAKFVFGSGNYKEFLDYARKNGAYKAYAVLKNRFTNNETAAHDFAHVVGQAAFEQKGDGGLSICDTAYNYGCFHGFIEFFLDKKGINAIGQVEQSCLGLASVHAPSCLHGIGHGVMIWDSYKVDNALLDCDRLAESSRIYCWDGVFMEKNRGSMIADSNRFKMTEATLGEPCNSVSQKYKEQCWRNQVFAWFGYYDGDFSSVRRQCYLLDGRFRKTCFEGIGFGAVANFGADRQKTNDICGSADIGQGRDDCLIGAMKEMLFEGKDPGTAQSLCGDVSAVSAAGCRELFGRLFDEYKIRYKSGM